jgi:enoyl-CoA hydratase/carnithine racemase
MTPQEAFKLGFLARCVEENFSQEKIAVLSDRLSKEANEILDTITDVGKFGLGTALAAPPLAGMLTSYLANKVSEPTELDVNEIRQRELLDEYRRSAQKLEHQRARRAFKQQANKNNSIYL